MCGNVHTAYCFAGLYGRARDYFERSDYVAAVVFSAFALEAFVNHLCAEVLVPGN